MSLTQTSTADDGSGAATEATLQTLTTQSDFDSKLGSLTETAPATDIASSGLNGRLQRVAQRLTSILNALAALVNGAFTVTGDTAHGVTDAGNPVEIGSQAIAFGTSPTAVTAGQRVRSYATRGGILFHLAGHPNVQTLAVQYTGAQTDTAVIAGVPHGFRRSICRCQTNGHWSSGKPGSSTGRTDGRENPW